MLNGPSSNQSKTFDGVPQAALLLSQRLPSVLSAIEVNLASDEGAHYEGLRAPHPSTLK